MNNTPSPGVPAPTPALDKALFEAQKKATALGKDAKNKQQGYAYTSTEAMMQYARDLMHAEGLMATGGMWEMVLIDKQDAIVIDKRIEQYAMVTYRVSQHMTLRHVESGEVQEETVNFPAVTNRGRPSDKAVAGALTTIWNYWLRDKLMLPRTDANDGAGSNPQMDDLPDDKRPPEPQQEQRTEWAPPVRTRETDDGRPVMVGAIKSARVQKTGGEEGVGKGPWTLYEIIMEPNVRLSTFSETIGPKAIALAGTGVSVDVLWEADGKYFKALGVQETDDGTGAAA